MLLSLLKCDIENESCCLGLRGVCARFIQKRRRWLLKRSGSETYSSAHGIVTYTAIYRSAQTEYIRSSTVVEFQLLYGVAWTITVSTFQLYVVISGLTESSTSRSVTRVRTAELTNLPPRILILNIKGGMALFKAPTNRVLGILFNHCISDALWSVYVDCIICLRRFDYRFQKLLMVD